MIFIGADHQGFHLKNQIIKFLKQDLNFDVTDIGAKTYDSLDDYPPIAQAATKKVLQKQGNCAILICGSGHGMCIAANRSKYIRAAVIHSADEVVLARNDDFINVLCNITQETENNKPSHNLQQIIFNFLKTPPSKETRHIRRTNQIDQN
jgi:ribose 5-phosphate isomerase B